ncbi:hypothetical protein H4905_002897 [Listeria monocytogenes]|uniref:hypothetical protein n=1 Tax=Listeria monocytogenes TaxID=1639 RepID=UPI00077A76A1|nr:hypothetical protein [Listeria monocytogenes]EAF4508045.1 hypothetical protein [Listeria monocytogenes serotype 1/2a]EAD5730190.1 hypothetical protein [Listeria monocytogenes]EAD5836418.1 hypothetical protein [Listeria monocytogenes]EAE4792467.1 hypothetical protein [Listeria monocytogenes]EAE8591270.1 hypothetical protein [Listeria monocytogenes]
MKKSFLKHVVAPIIVGLLVITPITHVSAAVRNVDTTPVITQKEVESGIQDNNNELPDEFIVRDQVNSSEPVNQERQLLKSASLGYEKWTKVSTTRKVSKGFIAWHPGWKNYQYNVSAYYFSKATMNVSASIGYGKFSMSVSKAGSNGQIIKANPKKWTRPAIYGNVDVTKYTVKKYNGAGIYTGSTTKYASTATSTYVQSRNK